MYKCKRELTSIDQLVKGKYLSILNLFIKIKEENNKEDKSYFYCFSQEKKELAEIELLKKISKML